MVRAIVVMAAVAMICAAIFSYQAIMGPGSPRAAATGHLTSIRCNGCDYNANRNTDELVASGQIDPLERVVLLGDARRCPKCGKQSLLVIEKQAKASQ